MHQQEKARFFREQARQQGRGINGRGKIGIGGVPENDQPFDAMLGEDAGDFKTVRAEKKGRNGAAEIFRGAAGHGDQAERSLIYLAVSAGLYQSPDILHPSKILSNYPAFTL
jgi:hypothetical protein